MIELLNPSHSAIVTHLLEVLTDRISRSLSPRASHTTETPLPLPPELVSDRCPASPSIATDTAHVVGHCQRFAAWPITGPKPPSAIDGPDVTGRHGMRQRLGSCHSPILTAAPPVHQPFPPHQHANRTCRRNLPSASFQHHLCFLGPRLGCFYSAPAARISSTIACGLLMGACLRAPIHPIPLRHAVPATCSPSVLPTLIPVRTTSASAASLE